MASHPAEEQSLLARPPPVTNGLPQDATLGAAATHHGASAGVRNVLESRRVLRTPLRSQQEKGTIEDRLKVYCYLPKRREPHGFYLSRSIPSKVDCFWKKRPTEASQD